MVVVNIHSGAHVTISDLLPSDEWKGWATWQRWAGNLYHNDWWTGEYIGGLICFLLPKFEIFFHEIAQLDLYIFVDVLNPSFISSLVVWCSIN